MRNWPKYGDNDRKYREVKYRERTADIKEPALHINQQAKCAMLPCLGYLESECEDCVNYNLYRKP
jgi:hypothetical protein